MGTRVRNEAGIVTALLETGFLPDRYALENQNCILYNCTLLSGAPPFDKLQ